MRFRVREDDGLDPRMRDDGLDPRVREDDGFRTAVRSPRAKTTWVLASRVTVHQLFRRRIPTSASPASSMAHACGSGIAEIKSRRTEVH
jgi:hypothetical protein